MFDLSELLGDAEGIDDDGIERRSVVFWFGSDPDLLNRLDDDGLEVELFDSLGDVGLISEGIDDEDVSTSPSTGGEGKKEEGEQRATRRGTRWDSRCDLLQHRWRSHLADFSSSSLRREEEGKWAFSTERGNRDRRREDRRTNKVD